MSQVIIKSGGTEKKQKSSGEPKDPKIPLAITVGVIALLVVVYFAYTSFLKPTGPAIKNETVAPPPGYPNAFPYNNKSWQDGKIPMGGGIPAPPSMGGKPPAGGASASLPGTNGTP